MYCKGQTADPAAAGRREMTMTRALIPLAEGVEEMEAVILIDILRRASWEVTTAGLKAGPVKASRGVVIIPDAEWPFIDPALFDIIVLPGGADGTSRLAGDARIIQTVQTFFAAGKWIAAVCAAPLILHSAGILKGRRVTCHPSVRNKMAGVALTNTRVEIDDRIVTSQGAGSSIEFAITLVRIISGPEQAESIRKAILHPG
jgi:protein deglycase